MRKTKFRKKTILKDLNSSLRYPKNSHHHPHKDITITVANSTPFKSFLRILKVVKENSATKINTHAYYLITNEHCSCIPQI